MVKHKFIPLEGQTFPTVSIYYAITRQALWLNSGRLERFEGLREVLGYFPNGSDILTEPPVMRVGAKVLLDWLIDENEVLDVNGGLALTNYGVFGMFESTPSAEEDKVLFYYGGWPVDVNECVSARRNYAFSNNMDAL